MYLCDFELYELSIKQKLCRSRTSDAIVMKELTLILAFVEQTRDSAVWKCNAMAVMTANCGANGGYSDLFIFQILWKSRCHILVTVPFH